VEAKLSKKKLKLLNRLKVCSLPWQLRSANPCAPSGPSRLAECCIARSGMRQPLFPSPGVNLRWWRRALCGAQVAELKAVCPKPEVVEVWDVTGPDPPLLVYLKARGARGRRQR
jgi:hypothetical protein